MIRKSAKPFLKWAGGKTQLISEIEKNLPNSAIDTYVEPFVGSGAILFWVLGKFSQLEKAVVNDINEDLINTYKTIQSTPIELISILDILQNEYHSSENSDDRKKEYYYQKRELFNNRKQSQTEHSALFIFLNRTCFNGLFRVNRKNEFNVPMGSYNKPTICDKSNILAVSEALQKVELLCGDFEQTINHTSANTLFYFDPPYKPLSETSSFNSYAKDEFNDDEQIRLKKFCDRLNNLGHNWILSNSDVKGKNAEDNFFDDLYADFTIKRVDAKRSINANPEKRGFLKELLITNQINKFEQFKFKHYGYSSKASSK
jgi:DNA adenine methylase